MAEVRISEKIGPAFYDVAKDVLAHGHTHYDLSGGRGSLKSSFVSVMVPLLGRSVSWRWRTCGRPSGRRWS